VRIAAAPSVYDLRQKATVHRSVPVQRRRYEFGIDRCGNTAVDQGATITRYVDHTNFRDLHTSVCADSDAGTGTDSAATAIIPMGHSRSGTGPSRAARASAGRPGAGRPSAGY